MRKPYVLLIVLIVVIGLVLGIFYFPKKFKKDSNNRKESDEKDTVTIISSVPSNNSPFGFIMGTSNYEDQGKNLDGMVDVGAGWVRLSGAAGVIWDLVEKKRGEYDWLKTDDLISRFYNKDIDILVTIGPANNIYKSQRGYYPSDIDAYNTFILKAVERYDGDGIDDAPGSPVVAAWQISNEIDIEGEWRDTMQNYAQLMKESYRSIKSANPKARVVVAGISSPFGVEKYSKALSFMRDDVYFDVFDFHWHAMFGGDYKAHSTRDSKVSYSFDEYLDDVKNILKNNGREDAEIWITEMSVSDIIPFDNSERSQAIDLIKRYIYSGNNGVDAIFWGTLYEQAGFAGKSGNENYFNTQGLINNSKNDGLSHNKLAYYTYKKMTEVLNGVDWGNIQVIQEVDGVYIYKLVKNNKSIWVAWNDGGSKVGSVYLGSDIKNVTITEAVPMFETGKDVVDYRSSFKELKGDVSESQLIFELSDRPVFIEEK